MAIQVTQEQVIHHASNVAAVAIPTAFYVNAAPILATITAFLGIVWYCIIIGEKFYGWKMRRDAQLSAMQAQLKAIDKKVSP